MRYRQYVVKPLSVSCDTMTQGWRLVTIEAGLVSIRLYIYRTAHVHAHGVPLTVCYGTHCFITMKSAYRLLSHTAI